MPADSSAPPMGQETQIATEGNHDQRGIGIASTVAKPGKKLSLIPLIFLIYFEVSGGPYGEEQTLQAAGPLFAIIGFVVFPIIWCIPEALITAELATAYPGNGGYVIWATEAFGPFWGFLLGWWKWVSGVINDAAFPVLFADYGKQIFPDLADGTPIRKATLFIFSFVLGILNYTGLSIIGWTSVALAVVSLLPCILMLFFAIPKIRPERWLSRGDSKKDWGLYLNNLFWNLNFWDSISTLAGEVENPAKTFPTALFVSGLLVCISYLIPILAGTGAMELNQTAWEDGYLAQAAATIAGQWLKIWIEIGALFSSVGLFNAQLSSCSYQLLGMAELGHLPSLFAKRSKWFNTPWVGILASMVLTIPLSYMSFTVVVSAANFMYSCGMLLEFAAFVWLRRKVPGKERPFRVPIGIPGLIGMLVVPTAFIGCVMVLAGKVVFAISAGLTVLGLVVYVGVWLCKSKHWLEFSSPVKEREVSSSGGV